MHRLVLELHYARESSSPYDARRPHFTMELLQVHRGTNSPALVLQLVKRDARRRYAERSVLGHEVVDPAKNYDAAHPSSRVPSSRGTTKRRRRYQRAGDAHAGTHAHTDTHTHIAHTFSVNTGTCGYISVVPSRARESSPRRNVRAIG